MSLEDSLRRQTQEQMRNNPGMQKIASTQAPDYWTLQVINNEIDNQRRRDEEARRR